MPKDEYDYDKLGLMVGIEIHQQLNSKAKLFCNCPTELQGSRDPDFYIYRKHRPVLGETGKFDKSMLVEFLKKGDVVYEGYNDCTCTYEYDETPPFLMDEEAIGIALEICLLFNMNIIREMHICRKNYVDGSVPGGFQRTAIIGLDGNLLLKNQKTIGINSVFLEEDAARRIETKQKTTFFRLDRLGIPLVEITTTPDINTPEEAKDAAYRIGLLLRSTNKVKRVLGSTRQDINISIKDGERIEIKGVQKLDWIPILVKNEIKRQQALISIKNTLKERGITSKDIDNSPKDVTNIFKGTTCKFVNSGIKKKQKMMALKIVGFSGLFGVETLPNQRFGTEVAGKVKVLTRLKGIIHSDEDLLGKYQFEKEKIEHLKKTLNVGEQDLFILLLGNKAEMEKAFDIIINRTIAAFKGVPPETRKAEEDGITTFLRELSGGRRLYPDTDSMPIIIDDDRINATKENVGPYPWDLIDEYHKKYSIEKDIIENMVMKGKITLFDFLIKIAPEEARLIIVTITDLMKSLRRDNNNTKNISKDHLISLFKALEQKKLAKEAFEAILQYWCENPSADLEKAMENAGISSIDEEELDTIINAVLEKNKALVKQKGVGAMGPLMGDLMKNLGRGTVDGKTLSAKLRKAIGEFTK